MNFSDFLKEPEVELVEAKFIYSDAEQKIKDEGYWDSFKKMKKGLKKTQTIVMELDKDDKIYELTLMSKADYAEMAQDKNWEEAMIRIFESDTTVKEEPLVEAKGETPEEMLRAAHFKIKLVAPTKFGTQIDFAKKYDDDEIKKVLKGFTLKFDDKSVFVID